MRIDGFPICDEQQFARPTIWHSTIETDNKRRPGILKRNASRFEPPSPDQPDPNSGACYFCMDIICAVTLVCNYLNMLEVKSEVIKRMQIKLEDWDHQLRNIGTKKKRNGALNKLIPFLHFPSVPKLSNACRQFSERGNRKKRQQY